jgi:hypothetical protein
MLQFALQESAAGWPVFLKLGDYAGLGGCLKSNTRC